MGRPASTGDSTVVNRRLHSLRISGPAGDRVGVCGRKRGQESSVQKRADYNGCHEGALLAQDRLDHLGDRLGPVLLDPIRPSKLPVFLRSGEPVPDARPVVGEPSDFLLAGDGLLLFQTLYTIDVAGAFSTGSHIVGGTEYMFDPNVPLFIRLLSLFHVATPPLLLWAIWRLGYDRRGWRYQTLTAWVVVPVNYFWRPQFDVNWARGPFFREQHAMPGLLYLHGIPSRGPAGRVLSHPPAAAMVGTTWRLPAGGRERDCP